MPSSMNRPALMRVLAKVGLEPATACFHCVHPVEDHVIWDETSLSPPVSIGRCFSCDCEPVALGDDGASAAS